MGLFGFGKKPVAAEVAGRNLTAHMIDADSCWRDVCGLRSYKTEGPIATCEMAFARAALVKFMLKEQRPASVAERIDKAADELILESFTGEDTEATHLFYGEPLEIAAPKRVAAYSEHAFMTSQLASVLGAKLGVPGMASIEIAPFFDDVARQVKALTAKIKLV